MKLQDKREALEKDDPIFLIVKLGEGLTKKKPAKVVEIRRGAALVLVGTERTPRLVRLSDIQIPDLQPPVLLDTRINLDSSPPPTLMELAPPPMAYVEPAPQPKLSAFETWLKMGEELLEEQNLEGEMLDYEDLAIREEEKDLRLQAIDLRAQLEVVEHLIADIPKRLEDIPRRRELVQTQIDIIKARLGRA